MKKILVLLIAMTVALFPVCVKAEERYSASYEKTDGDYTIEFEVSQKGLTVNGFYAGQRLDDYTIDGHCTYQGFFYDYLDWANPDYKIVEGTQTISVKAKSKDIIFDVEMEGLKRPIDKNTKTVDMVKGGDIKDLPWPIYRDSNENRILGEYKPVNYDLNRLGTYDLEYVFIPEDPYFDTIAGSIKINVWEPEPGVDEPTAPSLTATTVSLVSRTAYDINLNDKVSGCKYKWTSSNPEVADVNPKNGLVTAVAEGTATITCVITYPDETKQTLISEVTVGYDDNAPELTDTVLDLNPGDEYDINVENKIAKSKYRWASSDRSIITVNSANGIVNAKAVGEAYITCTITTPENQVIVLRCDINVTEPKEIK
jgi:hypothetical protein